MTYAEFRLEMVAAAEAWERAAETARLAGKLALAHALSENAVRCHYLAEPDPDAEKLFDEAARVTP